MPNINIIVREKIAQAVGDTHIVCGNSDYIAVFDFDAEWDAYETKTARFIWNGKYTDVVFTGTKCPVPVITGAFGVLVGVYAGNLHTTTAATVDTEKSILCRNGLPADPPPDVYAQIIAQLNGMASPEWKDIQDKPFTALGDGLSVDEENKLSVSGKIDAPQTATVGEVLTVEEVDEDGKPVKWKTAPAAAEQKQPDWAQNDTTAADYVKNRIGYDQLEELYVFTDFVNQEIPNIPDYIGLRIRDNIFPRLHFIRYASECKLLGMDEYGCELTWESGKTAFNLTYDEEKYPELKPNEVIVYKSTPAVIPYEYLPLAKSENIWEAGIVRAKTIEQFDIGKYNDVYVDGMGLLYSLRDVAVKNSFDISEINGNYGLNIAQKAGTAGAAFGLTQSDYPIIYTCYSSSGFPPIYKYIIQTIRGRTLIADFQVRTGEFKNVEELGLMSIIDDHYVSKDSFSDFCQELSDVLLFAPTTAQPGQIVKVKAVDDSGKITETEAVDFPKQKSLKWVTVHSSDLTEETTEIVVSADPTGKAIADYNPVGLTLILSTPADATQTDNSGAPWVFPSATKTNASIRAIGSIAGWKTTARDSVFAFYGGSSAMTCTGNVNTQLATYKVDGYALDGVRAMLNGDANHFPVGTHVEVAILCEVAE